LQAKQKLVRQAARACARAGLVNAYGHCSARLNGERFLVCAAKPMGLITPQDEGVIVNVEGALPAGVLGEVRAHQQIYARRPDVGGICRIMPPMLLSVAALGRSPHVRHGFGAYFYPAAPFWNDTGLLRSDDRAAGLATALGGARAILMRGNGAIVTGQTLEQAVVLSWYLEDAARVELDVARAGGGDAPLYTADEARERATFEGRVVERMWAFLTDGDPEEGK